MRRTSHEADSPQAWVQGHLHLQALVLLQHDALLHQQPVIGGDGHAHQEQAAGPENRGQQGEGPTAARAHLGGRESGHEPRSPPVITLTCPLVDEARQCRNQCRCEAPACCTEMTLVLWLAVKQKLVRDLTGAPAQRVTYFHMWHVTNPGSKVTLVLSGAFYHPGQVLPFES